MKVMISNIAIAVLVAGVSLFALGASKSVNSDGKSIFTANKCNTCHSVTAQSVPKTNANSKAPDLSGVGKTRNATWIGKYLMKEESLNGKQHGLKFKGGDADLGVLATWLGKQKSN
jgi:cytochrome c5